MGCHPMAVVIMHVHKYEINMVYIVVLWVMTAG